MLSSLLNNNWNILFFFLNNSLNFVEYEDKCEIQISIRIESLLDIAC